MADITANNVTDDYGNTSAWIGGVVPISTDNAIIPAAATISVSDTRAITDITVYGELAVTSTGNYTHTGDLLLSGACVLDVNSDGVFKSGANSTWFFTGSQTVHPTIKTTGSTLANPAIFGDSTGTYRAFWDAVSVNTYTDRISFETTFARWYSIDDGSAYFIKNGHHFCADGWSMPDSTFIDCGTISFGAGGTPNTAAVLDLRRCNWRNPRYKTLVEYSASAAFTAYRGWSGSTVVGNGSITHRFYVPVAPASGTLEMPSLVLRDCGIFNSSTALIDAKNSFYHEAYDNGSNVLIQGSSATNVGGSDFSNTLIHTDNANAHTMSVSGTSTNQNTFDGSIVFSSHNGSNPLLYSDKVSIQNCITFGGGGSWTTGGSANVDIHNNTHIDPNNDINGGMGFETANYTGSVDAYNNITYQRGGTAYGYLVIGLSPVSNQPLNIAGHNCSYNLTGTYLNTATPTTDLTANDITVDPQFVNENVSIATWDTANGGAGTTANAFDEALKVNGIDKNGDIAVFDTNYTHALAYAYVVDGITPQNTALQGTGYLGADIGALAVVPAGATITSSGALQADTAEVSGVTTNDPVSVTVFTTITTAGSVSGTIQADTATVDGVATVFSTVTVTDSLQADIATIEGYVTLTSTTSLFGSLQADTAQISGTVITSAVTLAAGLEYTMPTDRLHYDFVDEDL